VSVRQAVSSGSDHIQIQLQPADLGAVDVKLSINHDGRVTMVVSADRSDTLNLLQQDSGTLAQALRDAGLQTDSSSLSFNLRGGYQFGQQQGTSNGPALADDGSAGGIDGIDAVPTTTLRAHAGSLDIHV
jgi:flagellar hook-length control protein FliK